MTRTINHLPVTLQVEANIDLMGTLIIPSGEPPFPGVVYYHGRGSIGQKKYIPRADVVCRRGCICLTYDFRGSGAEQKHFAALTLGDGLRDALIGFDFLAAQDKIEKNRMGICGSSFGGYLASLVSEVRSVKSMVLLVPAVYHDDWLNETYSYIDTHRSEVSKFRSSADALRTHALRAISKFTGSLLIIGAQDDREVPRIVTEGYYHQARQAKARELVWLQDVGHEVNQEKQEAVFRRLAADWFVQTL